MSAGDVRPPVWDPECYSKWSKSANNYKSMAELRAKVGEKPRESFGLCVSLAFLEKGAQTAVEIPPSVNEHALIGWAHKRNSVFRIRRLEQKPKTRPTTSSTQSSLLKKRDQIKMSESNFSLECIHSFMVCLAFLRNKKY